MFATLISFCSFLFATIFFHFPFFVVGLSSHIYQRMVSHAALTHDTLQLIKMNSIVFGCRFRCYEDTTFGSGKQRSDCEEKLYMNENFRIAHVLPFIRRHGTDQVLSGNMHNICAHTRSVFDCSPNNNKNEPKIFLKKSPYEQLIFKPKSTFALSSTQLYCPFR